MQTQKAQSSIVYPKVKLSDISKAFWKGIKPYRWSLFLLLLTVVTVNVISSAIPLLYKRFFDIINVSANKAVTAVQLITIIFWVALLYAIMWFLYRLYSFVNSNFQAKVMALLKQQVYNYVMGHSYSFFTNYFAGSLVQKVNRFARAFERLADRIVWDFLSLITRIVSVIIVVSFINHWIALAIVMWAAIFLLINTAFSLWKIKYDIQVAAIDSKTTGYLADTITNQNTISLFNGFSRESADYKKITDAQARLTRFNWNLGNTIEAFQSFLGFGFEIVLFYLAIRYWKDGLISVGFFVMLQVYVLTLIEQLWNFNRVIRDIYQAYADAKEMVEITKLSHEIQDTPLAKELAVPKGKIEFKNLQFSFNETRKVLEGISLTIQPGEKVALIGPSGAGKTTLVRLLMRFYSATAGTIMVDGQDIAQVTQDSLHKNIAMVPQDPILFHRTLIENIKYGKPGASKDEVQKAAQLAHCDEFIKDLPFGFETYVGERGVKLSGGERQRVAIARAILKDAPILILDEATSSLDSHSEMLIQDAMDKLMTGKTTIVIAHRLSTIQKMDRIIVVDNGKIVEDGSHIELLKNKDSLYKKLWDLQAGGFLADEEKEEVEEEVDVAVENDYD